MKYFAFFLNKDGGVDTSIWQSHLKGPYVYDGIDGHGNEWYDFLHDGYELWISHFTNNGKNLKIYDPKIVLDDIKTDFGSDGEYPMVKHRYYGKWLIVKVIEIYEKVELTKINKRKYK